MNEPISCLASAPWQWGNMIEVGLGLIAMVYAAYRARGSGREWNEKRLHFQEEMNKIKKRDRSNVSDLIGAAIQDAFDRRDEKRELAENRSTFYLECAAWMGLAGVGIWLAVQAYSLPPSPLECMHSLQALIIRSVSRMLLLSSFGGFVAYLINLHKDAQREVQLHTQLRVTADAQRIIHMAIRPGGEYLAPQGTMSDAAKAFVDSVMGMTETNISIYAPKEPVEHDEKKKKHSSERFSTHLETQELLEAIAKMQIKQINLITELRKDAPSQSPGVD